MKKYKKHSSFNPTPIVLSIIIVGLLLVAGYGIKRYIIDTGMMTSISEKGHSIPTVDDIAGFLQKVAGISEKTVDVDKESNIQLRIGVLSDSHGATDNMKKALALMSAESVDIVLHLGDFTAGGEAEMLQSAQNALEQSGIIFYTIPGDHDFNWVPEVSRANYETYFGRSYNQVVTINNVHVVLYENSVDLADNVDRQAWLKSTLDTIDDDEDTLLFTARPLYNPYFAQKTDPDGEQLIAYLASQNVRIIVSGDLHLFSKNDLQEPYEFMTQYTAGAIGEYKNPLPQWLLVEVFDDGNVTVTPKPILSF